jgi:chromosome segregation ATPase
VSGACVIEHSLYFFLGFFLATLLALAVLPAFWRRAYRMTRREVEATLPLSPREIAAERDQLRAKFAVERLQMEQKITAIGEKRHQDMKMTGEKTVKIADLDETVSSRIADINALTIVRQQQDALLSQTQKTLDQVQTDLAARTQEYETITAVAERRKSELEASTTLAQNQAQELTALKSNMEAQFQRMEEISSAARGFRDDARKNLEEAKSTERRLRDSEKDRAILGRKLEGADELATKRDTAIAERDIKLSTVQEKLASVTSVAKEIDAAYKQEMRKANQLEALLKVREETITRTREEAAETARDLTKTIEKIRTDRHKLQSDLSEARAKAANLQRELNALKRLSSVSDLRVPKAKGNIINEA